MDFSAVCIVAHGVTGLVSSFVRRRIRRQQADHADRRCHQSRMDQPAQPFLPGCDRRKGKVVNWKFEGYNPAVLYRIGWKKDTTLKPGDNITVFGWRARDGGNWAHSREITLATGKKLFFGPPAGTGDGGNTPAVEVQ